MKILTLVENFRRSPEESDISPLAPHPAFTATGTEHGLSFWITTENHRLLFDTGASDLLLANAAVAGIDLSRADTVVISHGHYDHGGGLPALLSRTSRARICIQRSALENYISLHEKPRYIGLPPELRLPDHTTLLTGDLEIDSELRIFTGVPQKYPAPEFGHPLKVRTASGTLVRDDFRHEQHLIVSSQGKAALFSGCAHCGIVNIMHRCRELLNRDPDLVLSGFHLKKNASLTAEDTALVQNIASQLLEFTSVFYTCHCTGRPEYEIMKEIMGEQLHLIRTGEELTV